MTESEPTDDHFDPDAETVTDAWEGVFLYTSWGYNQTNVNLARIVDVSDSGKTVLCTMVKAEVVDRGHGSESLRPTAEPMDNADEFRMHVRNSGGDPVFRGSYPYIDGTKETGTRRGSLYPWSNKAGTSVHQTPHGYRH